MYRNKLLTLAAVALALVASRQASAQVTFQLIDTLDGFTLGTGNPGSVAAYGDTLYVGSLFGAGTITQIDDPLGTPTSAGQLTGSLALGGNGYVSLDTDGTTLVAASNNTGANDIVQVFNVADGALRYESLASGLPGPNTSRIDGAAIDPNTGNVWLTAFGAGLPTVLDPNSLTDVSDGPSNMFAGSPTSTGFRDLNFDPATGDLYVRGTNGVIGGERLGATVDDFTTLNSLGATAGFSQIVGLNNVNLQDSFQSAINIEFLPASFTGTEDLIISNTRSGQPTLTPFANQVLAFDANAGFDGANPFSLNQEGVNVPLTFLDSDGVSPFATAGSTNGIYDFSFDPVNEVLYVGDEDNGVIYIFGEPGPVDELEADFNGDGVVDLLDLDILGANFGLDPATMAEGDANGDGVVNLLDLDILGAEFGMGGSSSAVPEPATALAMLSGLALLATRRR